MACMPNHINVCKSRIPRRMVRRPLHLTAPQLLQDAGLEALIAEFNGTIFAPTNEVGGWILVGWLAMPACLRAQPQADHSTRSRQHMRTTALLGAHNS